MQEFPHFGADSSPAPLAASPLAAPASGPTPRVRIWPVFVALAASVALIIILQLAVGVVLGIALAMQGEGTAHEPGPEEIERLFKTPLGFLVLGVLSQTAFLAVTLVALRERRVARRIQLGLARPALPWWGYQSIALGSLLVAFVGNAAAALVQEHFGSDIDLAALHAQLGWTTGILFVAFLGIVPGLVEELFFRGYMQRRLLLRWPAWAAILVTSLAFAAVHIDLSWVAFALPIGVWLGVVAWRTGSIWPAVVSHMTVNSVVSVQSLAFEGAGASDFVKAVSILLLLATGVFGLVLSIVTLVRLRPPLARPVYLDVPPVRTENRAESELRAFDPGV
jgi:membrane protease YdiL (CAAX protease family)